MAFNNKNEIHTEFVMNLHLKTQQSFFKALGNRFNHISPSNLILKHIKG